MAEYFSNKNLWALILGGSGGMGFGTAKKLAVEGMNLILIYRDTRIIENDFLQNVENLKKETNVQIETINANALQADAVQSTFEKIKAITNGSSGIKLLLHAVSRGNLKLLSPGTNQLSDEDFKLTIHAMATSLYDWVKILLNEKLFSNNARIIALTSEGSSKSWPGYAAVGAAKSTLEHLCRSLAVELAPYNINTNVIQAGVTETISFKMIPNSEIIKEETLKRNPYKRLTLPEDVGNAVYLLCRDEANWINGALLHVDGGEHCL